MAGHHHIQTGTENAWRLMLTSAEQLRGCGARGRRGVGRTRKQLAWTRERSREEAGGKCRSGESVFCFVSKSKQFEVCLNADKKLSWCHALKKLFFF